MQYLLWAIDYLSIFIALLVLVIVVAIVISTVKNGISPMPSNTNMQLAVKRELRRLAIKGKVVDVGAGFGQLVIKLAIHNSSINMVGIENSFFPYCFSKMRLYFLSSKYKDAITLLYRDMYQFDYSDCQAVVCYLYPEGMQKLKQTISNQNIKHLYVISLCFAINELTPIHITTCNDMYKTKVYTYEITQNSTV